MKIYSKGNTAKQWILDQVYASALDRQFRVCDLGCGYGSVWPDFLRAHANVTYLGIDTDAKEIARAQKAFAGLTNATVKVADGQIFSEGAGSFDAVTAFSALEHVVDLKKFVGSALKLLKPGGRAYLNYDAGHFRSHNLKERLMVPLSQFLARLGVEGPYMKEVDDADLERLIRSCGGKLVSLKKFNLSGMKAAARGGLSDEAVAAWLEFELRLNELLEAKKLNAAFWSTVAVAERV